MQQSLPFTLRSPNAIDPVKTFTALLLSVVAGARRFAHTSLLRADTALHALLEFPVFPSTTPFATCSSASGRASVSVFSRACGAGSSNDFAGGTSWTKEIEVALDEAEYFLALLTRGSYVSEICRAVQLRSLRRGKCAVRTERLAFGREIVEAKAKE